MVLIVRHRAVSRFVRFDPELGFDEPDEAAKITEFLLADPAWRAGLAAREADRTSPLAPELIAARYLEAVA